jgi:hypothetical protein
MKAETQSLKRIFQGAIRYAVPLYQRPYVWRHVDDDPENDPSQALSRVREVARRGKKERFTALLHHISVDLLRQAFYDSSATPRQVWTV